LRGATLSKEDFVLRHRHRPAAPKDAAAHDNPDRRHPGIDLAKKQVRVLQEHSGRSVEVTNDQVVLANGAVTSFYRMPGLEGHALTMKTLGDAILARNHAIELLDIADNHVDESAARVR